MAGWWPVLLFLGFLFGGGMFILITGYVSTEAERTRARLAGEAPPVAQPRSSFLVPPEPKPDGPLDGAVVAGIARFVDEEQSLAEEFVARPVVHSLMRHVKRPLHEKDLHTYLAAERAAVAEFMANPSVDALYRRN